MPAEERTEKATPKKKRDERKKGNVFKSQEIITLFGLLGALFTISILGPIILNLLGDSIHMFWGEAATRATLQASDLQTTFVQAAVIYGICALPPLLVAGLVAIVFTLAQTRGLFASESVKPKGNRISPISGFKRMFSLKGLVELLKSIIKIIILAYVIYSQYVQRFPELPRLMEMDFGQVLFYAADFLMSIVTSVAIIFAFLAGADYLYQRWQFEKDLRMSKQEVKEEYKQTEGDPQIKGQIKQRQREMANRRMMQNVPQADVVIRNPTHYAVALRYEAGKNTAPQLLAKGADLVALRIVRVAEENKVAVVENRSLARGLYDNVPLDREIPEEFFQPVAEILAFVYSTTKKSKMPKN